MELAGYWEGQEEALGASGLVALVPYVQMRKSMLVDPGDMGLEDTSEDHAFHQCSLLPLSLVYLEVVLGIGVLAEVVS
jgi:hypothetical protein